MKNAGRDQKARALRSLRIWSGYTQRDVAAQLGISEWAVSRTETGRADITNDRFDQYVEAVASLNAKRKADAA